jgi:putative ABC transport system permease protein
VVGEVALALVLLAGAGLLMRSFVRLQAVNPGFNPAGAFVATALLPRPRYDTAAQYAAFARDVTRALAATPGIAAAAAATNLPFSGFAETRSFTVAGRPPPATTDLPTANHHNVGPAYFRAMGIPLLRGRPFEVRDALDAPRVAIVNEALARQQFSGADPLGRRIDLLDGDGEREIVGVVADVKPSTLEGGMAPQIYEPFAQQPGRAMTFVVRGAGGRLTGVPAAIRAVIARLDPEQPLDTARPLAAVIDDSLARQRFTASLFAVFSAVALLLAAIGIYGVVAYAVGQRTGEIGIRMALGARAGGVVRLVLAEGGRLVALGVAVGLTGAFVLTRGLERLLYGVSPHDPLTFLVIPALLAAVAACACLVPAWRATRVDPMTALRTE